jgi:predicted DNA-binding protein YlxM (UPF0122 family)
MVDFEEVSHMFESQETFADSIFLNDKPEYTRADMMEVIGFILKLDFKTLDVLSEKIAQPDINFAEIARTRNISRQAIHKFIKKKCEEVPELESLLRNRKKNIKQKKQNFMEAVCLIKQQMSREKLKRQKRGLRCSRRLISLNQNLDLSGMSIFKGSIILSRGSKS